MIALRRVAPSALLRGVREHLERRLVEAFAWPSLRTELRETGEDAPAGRGVDPLPIVQAGIARHWSFERALASLGERASQRPRTTSAARSLLGRLRGGAALEDLLEALDGHATLGSCLSAAPTPEVWAAGWLLDATGALAFEEERAEQSPTTSPSIEIVVAGQEADATDARTEARERSDDATVDASAELRREVEQLHATLGERSHYELLELEQGASLADVRLAYRRAAKRLHPDALTRLGLEDLKEQANEVFSAIAHAHATLADPARRREYDTGHDGSGPDAESADRLGRAETLYRKAQVLLRAGRFVDALPLLQAAVSLWPEEGVYHGDLGWALFKIAQPRLPEARASLERAVELDPRSALAHERLGLVLAALGDGDRAAEHRARAQALERPSA